MTRRLWPVLLAALVSAPQAEAATFTPLTLEQQAKKANVVVRAVLGEMQKVKEGDVTYLAYPLEVSEVIAGDPATLPQVGGKPALFILEGLRDVPTLSAKQEGLMLLYTGKLDSPFVGFSQGWYPLADGKVKAGTEEHPLTAPDALRDAIRTARGDK